MSNKTLIRQENSRKNLDRDLKIIQSKYDFYRNIIKRNESLCYG